MCGHKSPFATSVHVCRAYRPDSKPALAAPCLPVHTCIHQAPVHRTVSAAAAAAKQHADRPRLPNSPYAQCTDARTTEALHVAEKTPSCRCSGKLQADAAAAAGVKVFQFSTQEDVEKRTQARRQQPNLVICSLGHEHVARVMLGSDAG